MNMVNNWLCIITRRAIGRSTLKSMRPTHPDEGLCGALARRRQAVPVDRNKEEVIATVAILDRDVQKVLANNFRMNDLLRGLGRGNEGRR
jgi:hypothetical protein